MHDAIRNNQHAALASIDSFVDGAAVKCPDQFTDELCRELLDEVVPVPESQVCLDLLKMYHEQGIVFSSASK